MIDAETDMSEQENQRREEVVAVLGAGSWGTALANLARPRAAQTRLWTRSDETARRLQAQNSDDDLKISADLVATIRGADWIVVAVPCAGVAELAAAMREQIEPRAIVVSGTKGLDPQSGRRASQLWRDFAALPDARFAALSGPNLSTEINRGIPTSTVVASLDEGTAQRAQQLFSSPVFRVYTNSDLIGVELGGALKNIVAIAAGICDGLGFGDNSKGALITRAWHEMTCLAIAVGARQSTLYGISGIGDLIATCVSPLSRNYRLGHLLGRGATLAEAQLEIAQAVEGVHTSRAALKLAAHSGLELPITAQVAAVLFEKRDPRRAVTDLMNRQWRGET